MKIRLRGWNRDHGYHTLVSKSLKADAIGTESVRIRRDEVAARVLHPDTDLAHGVQVYFGASGLRLGGDYFGELTFSKKEILRLFRSAYSGDELGAVLNELAEC